MSYRFNPTDVNRLSTHLKGLPKLPEKSLSQQIAERIASEPLLLVGLLPFHSDMVSDGLTTKP